MVVEVAWAVFEGPSLGQSVVVVHELGVKLFLFVPIELLFGFSIVFKNGCHHFLFGRNAIQIEHLVAVGELSALLDSLHFLHFVLLPHEFHQLFGVEVKGSNVNRRRSLLLVRQFNIDLFDDSLRMIVIYSIISPPKHYPRRVVPILKTVHRVGLSQLLLVRSGNRVSRLLVNRLAVQPSKLLRHVDMVILEEVPPLSHLGLVHELSGQLLVVDHFGLLVEL